MSQPTAASPAPAALPEDAQYAGRPDPVIRLDLPAGPVYCVLFPDAAPKHSERILMLAAEGFYNGIRFHRIVPNFVAQIGDPKSRAGVNQPGVGSGGSKYGNLPLEVNRAYKNVRGSLAMARTNDPHSANSQFYIVLKDSPHLDMQYTVFGQVQGAGMDIVDKLKVGDPMSVFIVKR
jgi:cyclophilin family peptidyl-prolyl cis-trans isomerase